MSRCAGCGRRLRDPASIAAGLGPVCRRALQPQPPTVVRLPVAVPDEPPPAVSGQLPLPIQEETTMTTRPPAADLPQLAVPCPRCAAPAHQLCTSHGGSRQRRHDTHMDRRPAWVAAGRPNTAEEPNR